MARAQTVVSSPGKVLLAGGYLVLDPKHQGVVVSTSARFYTVVQHPDFAEGKEKEEGKSGGRGGGGGDEAPAIRIRVRSPQFVDATWVYGVRIDGGKGTVEVEQLVDKDATSTKNKFVHTALSRVLQLALELEGEEGLRARLGAGYDIVIAGDNDFYSQRAQLTARNLPPTLASLSQLPPFLHTGVQLSAVHKTGLGSSAALITSLVSAILLHLGIVPTDSFSPSSSTSSTTSSTISSNITETESASSSSKASDGRKLVHNTAQYVHCLAQGKVGSGFDVASAVFGSQLYTRFDPAVLQPLMDNDTSNSSSSTLAHTLNAAWDYRVAPFRLPPQTRLMLADVDAGSDTPSLVGKVLKWRKENSAQADALWGALDVLNQALAHALLGLSRMFEENAEEYAKVVKYLASLQSVQWLAHPAIPQSETKVIEGFAEARRLSEGIREKMREMGTLAGVPIEPPEQTELLDACVGVAGVIGGGVPGAGGYDAIWVLVFEPASCADRAQLPSTRVESLWAAWKNLDVSPLAAAESTEGGVRVERVEDVSGLAGIL
ncbi:Phosphomevalonate kinase [Trametopsis cervina]|nr:Phosphomevalonate kinase [Trametopsis cervina]